MSKKLKELRSKVASLNGQGTILKVADLEDKAFVVDVSATNNVTGKYGEQQLIVGNYVEGDLKHTVGDEVRLYLNNRRQEVFETSYDGKGMYAFIFGASVEMKSGHSYIPLDLVEKV